MKTPETERMEQNIRSATRKMGVFGCFEVTIGFNGKERVDYMTYDTKGIFRCYEIKVKKADFRSSAKKSFCGHYNYYVMPQNLYEEVKEEIPSHIGVYIGAFCEKRPKKQELTISADILKDSMIRSLYRDSDKLQLTNDGHTLDRLRRQVEQEHRAVRETEKEYGELRNAIREKYGREALRELI